MFIYDTDKAWSRMLLDLGIHRVSPGVKSRELCSRRSIYHGGVDRSRVHMYFIGYNDAVRFEKE